MGDVAWRWRWPGADDLVSRAGQCYTLGMEAVLANVHLHDRLYLVHGLLHPERATLHDTLFAELPAPPPNPHAWLELEADDGVMCLDPVLRLADVRDAFYATFGCEPVRRYRADVAVLTALRRDNYGPWDRRSLEQWQERQAHAAANPEWTTERVVARYLEKGRTA